ncbi:MAG TPA: hypothetical protein VNF47_22315 [Streptosporangiaceae bacterium]|nr:hypothetical protein [Streptosporangiaceae bacterium]
MQATRTRRCWFAGFRKEYAWRASGLAIRFRLSGFAFVIPVSTALASSFPHREMVRARVSGSGMSSPVTLVNWAGDRCSRSRVSRLFIPCSPVA